MVARELGGVVVLRRMVTIVGASALVVVLFAGAAAAWPRHGDDGNGGTKKPAHDMPGMTDAEMAAMDDRPTDDKGLSRLENGEMAHQYGPDQPLDAATRARLVHQLGLTTAVAARYPTLGAAKAAGYKQAGAFEPGLGTHMTGSGAGMAMSPDGTIADTAISSPGTIIYDGIADDAPIAGFMYTTLADDEPGGFAGPNDHWHYHDNICVRTTPEGIKTVHVGAVTTKRECARAKATWVPQNVWMVHVWTIPGYASNRGVFSDVNPSIACADGTYHRVPEKDTRTRYKLNHCRSEPA